MGVQLHVCQLVTVSFFKERHLTAVKIEGEATLIAKACCSDDPNTESSCKSLRLNLTQASKHIIAVNNL